MVVLVHAYGSISLHTCEHELCVLCLANEDIQNIRAGTMPSGMVEAQCSDPSSFNAGI